MRVKYFQTDHNMEVAETYHNVFQIRAYKRVRGYFVMVSIMFRTKMRLSNKITMTKNKNMR